MMSTADYIRSFVELGAVVFTIWALFNEDRIADWEDKIPFIRDLKERINHKKG